jgi:ribokinase
METRVGDRILVAGSINTDLVVNVAFAPAAGETVTGTSFGIFGGGKGANQAVAAARAGARVAMLGGVGDDDFGRRRLADLQAEGIDCGTIQRVSDRASGVAMITVEASGENRIAYVPGATWGVPPGSAVGALGSWQPAMVLQTLELPRETLLALASDARKRGVQILCNATPEPSAARELAMAADVLIVNEIEAAELLGLDREPDDWIRVGSELRAAGARTVVITLGSSGALVAGPEGDLAIAALKVGVVDTTGAGDAFCGAFAAELASGADVYDAARVGVVGGSLAVTRAGAQPSMPTRQEIDRRLNA